MTMTGRGSDRFMLRLPEGLRDKIKERAAAEGRSMNSEIVGILMAAFSDQPALDNGFQRALASLDGLQKLVDDGVDRINARIDAKGAGDGSSADFHRAPLGVGFRDGLGGSLMEEIMPPIDERVGDWMQTASGRVFWPVDPRPGEVFIEDIAHALSLMCRYCGHTLEFYSVAQHSVLVSQAVSKENKLWALLHDASEAYVVDVPRPLKPSLTGYHEIERRVMDAICDRFGLPREEPTEVKRVDNAILADEAEWMMAPPRQPWLLVEPPLGIKIEPWPPRLARQKFLAEFRRLSVGV